MPNRFAVIVVIAALASATTISVTGQQEPLPRVTPRGTATAPVSTEEVREAPAGDFWRGDQLVVLPSDPIHQLQPVTLADAARNNDYATFHALYVAAREQGRDVSAFTTLHDVWTYSVTNPVGAFYGRDTLDRLARSYPGFAAFIEPYRIVDNRGHAFYPTAETRAFLLQQALQGTTPTAVVTLPSSPSVSARASEGSSRTSTGRSTASRSAAPRRSSATAADAKPVVTTPAVTASRSTTTARRPAIAVRRAQAPVEASRSAAPAQPPVSTPATTEALVGQTAVPSTTQPLTDAIPATEATPVETAAPATTSAVTSAPAASPQPLAPESSTGRGLLLLIIGLMGVGILALMLRTPREEVPHSIIDHSAASPSGEAGKKQANVEPIRKRTGDGNAPHRRTRTGA